MPKNAAASGVSTTRGAAGTTRSRARGKACDLASVVRNSAAAQLRPDELLAEASEPLPAPEPAPAVAESATEAPAPPPPAIPAPPRENAESERLTRLLLAENEIKTAIAASVAVSVVPVPLFDIAAVSAIQLRMIARLSQLYGKRFSEHAARNALAALGGGVFGFGAGATVAVSLTKIVPGVGWMLGMVSLPVVAGATTHAVGRVFLRHFEDGGGVDDLRAQAMRAYFQQELEEGRKLAAEAKP